jgi:hypothetical protein
VPHAAGHLEIAASQPARYVGNPDHLANLQRHELLAHQIEIGAAIRLVIVGDATPDPPRAAEGAARRLRAGDRSWDGGLFAGADCELLTVVLRHGFSLSDTLYWRPFFVTGSATSPGIRRIKTHVTKAI